MVLLTQAEAFSETEEARRPRTAGLWPVINPLTRVGKIDEMAVTLMSSATSRATARIF